MDFGHVMIIGILGIIGIAALGFTYSTFLLGKKLIGQFKCKHCKKYNKALTGKCSKCKRTMTKGEYKYKSMIFGRVSIKNKNRKNVLIKAIKWITLDATVLIIIAGLTIFGIIKIWTT